LKDANSGIYRSNKVQETGILTPKLSQELVDILNVIISLPPFPLYISIFRSKESSPITAATENVPRFTFANFHLEAPYEVLMIALHQYLSLARISCERHPIQDETAKIVLELNEEVGRRD
jgi:hypothetical protein